MASDNAGPIGGSKMSSSFSSTFFSALRGYILKRRLLNHVDCDVGEFAHHTFDVAADVTDLSEFRRFDLNERRIRETCKPASDLGFPDAGRADH